MEVKRRQIIMSGGITGGTNALIGSSLFTLIAILMLGGFSINYQTLDIFISQAFISGKLISFMFSAIPGAIVLSNGVYSLKRVWIIGLVIGALAGLIIDFVGILLSSIHEFIMRLAVTALIVLSIMGGFGSQSLAKKFIRSG